MRRRAPGRQGLVLYGAIAFAVTWVLVLPIGMSAMDWWPLRVSGGWHTLGALGPLAGAIWVLHLQGSLDWLTRGWLRWRVSPWLYLAALSPLLLLLPAAAVVGLTEGSFPEVGGLASSDRLSQGGWLTAMLLPALAYAAGEETGWRGYLLPRLQHFFTPWRASLLLAVVWVLWHAPFYLYRPGMAGSTPAEIAAQAVVIAIGAFFLAWLYNSSGGSIFLVAIWHFTHSVAHIVVPEISQSWEVWSGTLSTLFAIVVLVVWRRGLSSSGTTVELAWDPEPVQPRVGLAVSPVSQGSD